jgi:hypothetical protein
VTCGCLMSPATSFTQGARSSTPGRWRDPLVLGPWLSRAPRHAHDSLRRGELDAWLPTSSTRVAASLTQARGAQHLATGELPSAATSSGFGRRKLLAAAPTQGAWCLAADELDP